jgi:hypothetical protein
MYFWRTIGMAFFAFFRQILTPLLELGYKKKYWLISPLQWVYNYLTECNIFLTKLSPAITPTTPTYIGVTDTTAIFLNVPEHSLPSPRRRTSLKPEGMYDIKFIVRKPATVALSPNSYCKVLLIENVKKNVNLNWMMSGFQGASISRAYFPLIETDVMLNYRTCPRKYVSTISILPCHRDLDYKLKE